MSAVIPFDFETNAVRIVMIDEAPWFVAVDICRVLGHGNPTVALTRLDDDEKQRLDPKLSLGSSVAGGGAQMMNVISESGLFALILTSNKPEARRFRKWVTAEVLPSIRRDGTYRLPKSEQTLLRLKREFYASLPPAQKARAIVKADALRQINKLADDGYNPTAAIKEVAALTGIGGRTLWDARRKVWMVAPSDYEAALAPLWRANVQREMLADCHPDAMIRWFQINRHGTGVSANYQQLLAEARVNGWQPIPSERTMRRMIVRLMPQTGVPRGKRASLRQGEV